MFICGELYSFRENKIYKAGLENYYKLFSEFSCPFWKTWQTMTRCGVNKSKTNHFMNLQSSLRGKESIELDAKTLRSK